MSQSHTQHSGLRKSLQVRTRWAVAIIVLMASTLTVDFTPFNILNEGRAAAHKKTKRVQTDEVDRIEKVYSDFPSMEACQSAYRSANYNWPGSCKRVGPQSGNAARAHTSDRTIYVYEIQNEPHTHPRKSGGERTPIGFGVNPDNDNGGNHDNNDDVNTDGNNGNNDDANSGGNNGISDTGNNGNPGGGDTSTTTTSTTTTTQPNCQLPAHKHLASAHGDNGLSCHTHTGQANCRAGNRHAWEADGNGHDSVECPTTTTTTEKPETPTTDTQNGDKEGDTTTTTTEGPDPPPPPPPPPDEPRRPYIYIPPRPSKAQRLATCIASGETLHMHSDATLSLTHSMTSLPECHRHTNSCKRDLKWTIVKTTDDEGKETRDTHKAESCVYPPGWTLSTRSDWFVGDEYVNTWCAKEARNPNAIMHAHDTAEEHLAGNAGRTDLVCAANSFCVKLKKQVKFKLNDQFRR